MKIKQNRLVGVFLIGSMLFFSIMPANCEQGSQGKIVFNSVRDGNLEIYIMDANGKNLQNLTKESAIDELPVWSPDGSKIAFVSDRDTDPDWDTPNLDIYIMDANGHNVVRITDDRGTDWFPAWSPDGTQIAFTSSRDRAYCLYVMNTDGTNIIRLTDDIPWDDEPAWSPDGTKIVFCSFAVWEDGEADLKIRVIDADGSDLKILEDNAKDPAWSPDGRKIAFSSDRDGNDEIYVMNADGTRVKRLTNNVSDDNEPSWSPDGSKIAFVSDRDGNKEIYVMDADGENEMRLTNNEVLDDNPAWCCSNYFDLVDSAESLLNQAKQSFENFEFQDAEEYANQARQIYQQLGDPENISIIDDLIAKYQNAADTKEDAQRLLLEGEQLKEQGEYEAAKENLLKAKEKFQSLGIKQKVSEVEVVLSGVEELIYKETVIKEAETLFDKGKEAFEKEDYESALEYFKQAKEKYNSVGSEKATECDQWIEKTQIEMEKGFCLGTIFLVSMIGIGLLVSRRTR